MSDQTSNERMPANETREGFTGADVLAVLAVSTFLAAIGLITFFATTAFA